MCGKKVLSGWRVRVFRAHDEHQYPEVTFLSPGEMSGISQICTITLVFRLAAPEFHFTACRAAGSPVTTALTKWSRSVLADLVPAIEPNLHPALQNKASCCLYSFTVILSLNLVPLTWKNLKYCNIWNTACKEPAVDQAQQHWWQKKALSTEHKYQGDLHRRIGRFSLFIPEYLLGLLQLQGFVAWTSDVRC